ncbi:unnamed protein product [Cunninghamella blakesleeana]
MERQNERIKNLKMNDLSLRRTKSLTRPERRKPRQGILRSVSITNNRYQQQQGYNTSLSSSSSESSATATSQPPYLNRPTNNDENRIPYQQPLSEELTIELEKRKKEQLRKSQHFHLLKQDFNRINHEGYQKNYSYHHQEGEVKKVRAKSGWWSWFAFLATCCFPSCFIRVCLGKSNKMMRQAWREKVTLCYIILFLCLVLAYLSYGLGKTICPEVGDSYPYTFRNSTTGERLVNNPTNFDYYSIFGSLYPIEIVQPFFQSYGLNLTLDYGTVDLGPIFDGDLYNDCDPFVSRGLYRTTLDPCRVSNPYGGFLQPYNNTCLSLEALNNIYSPIDNINFEWDDFRNPLPYSDLVVLGNNVVNLTRYFNTYRPEIFGEKIHHILNSSINNDGSYGISYYEHGLDAMDCISAIFTVGVMQTDTDGCIAANIITNLIFSVVVSTIAIRFIIAILFQWVISRLLVKPGGRSNWLWAWRSVQGGNSDPDNHVRNPIHNYHHASPSNHRHHRNNNNNTSSSIYQLPTYYPTPRNSSFLNASQSNLFNQHQNQTSSSYSVNRFSSSHNLSNNNHNHNNNSTLQLPSTSSNQILLDGHLKSRPNSVPPTFQSSSLPIRPKLESSSSSSHYQPQLRQSLIESHTSLPTSPSNTSIVETELYTCLLVTCYSEGEEGLRTTLDSLAETTYSKKHKIYFIIADGIITGAGETKSTPDIVIDMMDIHPDLANPTPMNYLAIADGEKQLNMAKVYAGHYKKVPCITIVKCGTPEEQNSSKPGNRGKRDSQLILMSFFQRVLFNDRFSELDYDLFWKMTLLMEGVTPDKFELVLMVDADTKVLPESLTYMVATMANDITIMGLCGETKIANKTASWVTAIQVFEYYISHHYTKAFESLFGIVTCLPGCFSMYRIKAPKNGGWVPILANPDIIMEYNQNEVHTLHEKNLLLLGEDRFLSTLMLRSFPRRQMMFVPQALCKTVVPDTFSVLLSQRRRWINSTVHNLMELALVSDLCGIGCLSMQFSILIDLVATLVLPAAVILALYLIITAIVTRQPQWLSIGLLLAVLGLPGILIVITTRKFIYISWMIIYIIALPIWQFVLPVYSFWHFDDFSWGATRVTEDEKNEKKKGMDPHSSSGRFDSSRLVMKKWEDWETIHGSERHKRLSHAFFQHPSKDHHLNDSNETNDSNEFNDTKDDHHSSDSNTPKNIPIIQQQ